MDGSPELSIVIAVKDGATVLNQALIFVPLAAGSILVAVCVVYARMRLQRRWRAMCARSLRTPRILTR